MCKNLNTQSGTYRLYWNSGACSIVLLGGFKILAHALWKMWIKLSQKD